VAEVLTRMRDIASDLPASDGAGVFNGVYLKVTEMVQDRLTTGGVFMTMHSSPTWTSSSPTTGSARTTPPATNRRPGLPYSLLARTQR
jgi:Family of unknown function (DUF5995)